MNELDLWIEARDRCGLTDAEALMARELQLSPADLHRPEKRADPWKRPLREYISDRYVRRFARSAPLQVVALETMRDSSVALQQKLDDRRRRRPAVVSATRSPTVPVNFRDSGGSER